MPDRHVITEIDGSESKTDHGFPPKAKITSDPAYRPDIDGLRALAVLAVIGFHAFPARVPGGFIGVDIFFVISGFLISGIILRGLEAQKFNFWEFYSRRIRGIFPALTVVLFSTLLMGWFLLLPDEYARLGKHTTAGALFVSNWVLWGESGYFDIDAAAKPLLHLWSLGVEEQFYLVWPLFLVWIFGFRKKPIFAVAVVLLFSFALNIAFVGDHPEATFFLPFTRFWELLVGAMLAGMSIRLDPDKDAVEKWLGRKHIETIRFLLSLTGLSLIGISIAMFNKDSVFPGWLATLPAIGTALVMASGASSWLNRHLLASRPAVGIGLISYPLYLWHWALLFTATHLLDSGSVTEYRQYRIGAVVLSFVLAYATYMLVERPLRRVPAKAVALKLCMCLGVVAVVGVGIFGSEGALRQRFNGAEISAFEDLQAEKLAQNKNYRYGSCLLLRPKKIDEFGANCQPKGGTDITLLGDSYAAHLYPGLSELSRSHSWTLGQLTASACPPVLNFSFPDRPNCKNINEQIFDKKTKSKIIVLAADWPQYWSNEGFSSALRDSLVKFSNSWSDRIILVGPAVAFPTDQLRWVIRKGDIGKLKSSNPRITELRAIDEHMRLLANELNVEYVSPVTALCNVSECQYAIPTVGGTKLLAIDSGHLTDEGSRFYARKLLSRAIEAILD